MVPGPLFASPPDTDQVTAALPPPVSVAVNCSTDEPRELVVLQPVQLVSMALAPGVITKASLEGAAVTPPIPQPAMASIRSGRKSAASRRGSLFCTRDPTTTPARSGERRREPGATWALCCRILVLSFVA